MLRDDVDLTPETEKAGRVVLVTGASRGIGAGIATRLQAAGYRVAGISTTGKVPEGVLGVACDVTDRDSVEAAYATVEAELGPVELLVANAGITKDGLAMRMSADAWQQVLDVNLTGVWNVVQRALRPMVKARFGRIVLMGSVSGLTGVAGQANYSASKAALVGLSRALSREVGQRGITVNVVAPGFIQTDMTDVLDEELQAKYVEQIPVRRMGTVDDVASTVAHLLDDQSGYITGAVIPVDGGLGMGH